MSTCSTPSTTYAMGRRSRRRHIAYPPCGTATAAAPATKEAFGGCCRQCDRTTDHRYADEQRRRCRGRRCAVTAAVDAGTTGSARIPRGSGRS